MDLGKRAELRHLGVAADRLTDAARAANSWRRDLQSAAAADVHALALGQHPSELHTTVTRLVTQMGYGVGELLAAGTRGAVAGFENGIGRRSSGGGELDR